jgi:hypothetical protein
MFYVLQDESTAARRRVPILLTDAATGTTAQTGVATTTIFPYVNINGGAFAGGAGTIGEAGFGQYYYEMDPSEVATLGLAGIHITASGCRDYDAIAQVAAFNLYGVGSGISAYDVWAFDYINAPGGVVPNSSAERLEETRTEAYAATTNTNDIGSQVWNRDPLNIGDNITGDYYSAYLYQLGTGATGYAGVALTAGDVWDYAGGRTITGGIADTVTLVSSPVEISYPSMAGVANTIWSTDVSGYTNPSAGYDLTQAASGGLGLTAGDVWEYDISGILTAGSSGKQLNTAATPSGAGISAYDVWDFNITGFGGTNSAAVYVTNTNFTVGNIETYVANQTPQDVWTYAGIEGRTITGGLADTVTTLTNPANITTGSMTGIAGTVWSAGTRTITGGTATTVTNPVDITTTSMSGIANTVWATDVSGYASPSAGYDLSNASTGTGISAADVWNYDVTTLPVTTTAGGNLFSTYSTVGTNLNDTITNIPGLVWSEDVANSSYGAGTAGTLLYDASLSGGGITAGDVWSFVLSDSNTAEADLVQAAAGSGLTAGDVSVAVWDSPVASYTSSGTFGLNILRSDVAGVAGTVSLWTGGAYSGIYADTYRIDADYNAAIALKDILTGIGASITGNITGDLSGSVGSVTADVNVSTASMTGIAGTIWSTDISGYTSPSAGYSLYNATGGVAVTAGDIWSYATRTITGGIADTVTTVSGNVLGSVNSVVNDVTISTGTQASIANSVWSFDISTGPASPSAAYYIDNINTEAQSAATDASTAASNTNDIGGTVWGYDPTALTSPQAGAILTDIQTDTNTIITDIGNVPNNVWASDVSGYSTPGEAGFELSQAAAGAGLTSGDVWSYATRTITGGIADTVTTLTDRAGFAITGGTVDTVTNGVTVSTNNDKTGYALSSTQTFDLTGNITGSVDSVTNPVTFDSAQYAGIASSVWNAATRTLTSSGSGISAFDVWNFVLSDANTAEVDLVQAAAGSGLTSGDVWSYASRTITGGIADTVTTLTNRSGFAITGGTVDNVTNGVTVSTNNDKTGYSLSSTQSFNLTGNITGNLSGSVGSVSGGVTVTTNNDKTGYALSGAGVSAVQSGLSTLTTAQVGQEVDASLLDVGLTSTVTGRIDATVSSRLASASYVVPPTEAAIAGTVWGYSPRTLTSGAGATAGDVWNYPTRSLTSGAGITVSAATNIINGPYFVKSNVDGQDGTLDVIRGMVQDIQLTVTDAFQNPFDTTALGLLVNFYDQAGTLTTSYGTTQLYGPAGLVQFTLDTAVTGTEGRYNLILSAAGSGNTIKFGPLQTLVRPF